MSPQQERIIRSVEDTLISSGKFSLPGKKKLLEPEHTIEVVVVDVTQSPIERPQKTETLLQRHKEPAYTQVPSSGRPIDKTDRLYRTWQGTRT